MIIFFLIFLFIFSPDLNFLPLNFVTLLGVLSFLILLIKYPTVTKVIILKNLLIFIMIIIVIIYSFSIEIYNDIAFTTNNYSILNIRLIVECFIPALLIGILLYKNKYNFITILNLIVWVSSFQILFIIVMLDLDIKFYIMSTIMKIPLDSIVYNNIDFPIRVYGLAKNHLSSFPFVQGLIFVISILLYYFFNKKIYLVLALIILITIIFNARIGLVPIVLFCITYLFILCYKIIYFKNIRFNRLVLFNNTIITLLSIILFIISITYFQKNENFKNALERSYEAMDSTLSIFDTNRNTSGVYAILINEHILLPKNIKDLIFGTGKTELDEQNRSDIGYLRLLNYGGIIFSFLYYLIFFMIILRINSLTKKLEKSMYKIFRVLPFIFFLSFFIAQIKGEFIALGEALRFLFLYWIILELEIIYIKKNNKI